MNFYFKCPNCGSNEEFTMPSEEMTGLGCSLLVFGGLIPALLYWDVQRRRVQCAHCKFVFRQPAMPRSAVSIFATCIIALALLSSLALLLAVTIPEVELLIPDTPFIRELEQIIAQHPRAVIIGLFPIVPVLILVCLVASWIGNFRYRTELRKTCRTRVEYFTQTPLGTAPRESAARSQPSFPVQTQDRPTQSP